MCRLIAVGSELSDPRLKNWRVQPLPLGPWREVTAQRLRRCARQREPLAARRRRAPQADEFRSMISLARSLDTSVRLVLCASARFDTHPFLVLPAPILVPPLATRREELPRIVDEYGHDGVAELRAREASPREVSSPPPTVRGSSSTAR